MQWHIIWHADVSWPPLELITFWCQAVDFSPFGGILTKWSRLKLQFPGIFLKVHEWYGLKFAMLMYPNRLQSWFVFGQSGVPQLLDLQIYLFTSIFWYPKKCKRQTLAHENYPINERGYPWLLCSQTSLVMLNVGYLKLDVSGNISDFIQLFVTLLYLIFTACLPYLRYDSCLQSDTCTAIPSISHSGSCR